MVRPVLFVVSSIVTLAISVGAASGCSFNTDCAVGSKCLKAVGSLYGVCVGGLMPGNRYDQQPVVSPLDLNQTYGDTCSFNTDCGPGSVCYKPSPSVYGTCVKSR